MGDVGNEIAEFIYYTPGKWDKEGQFWPVRAGVTKAKPGYCVGPKRIECYSMHFVREGSVELHYEGRQKLLHAGDVFCLFPERTYTYRRMSEETELRMCWLAIDGPGVNKMMRRAGFRLESPFVEGAWSLSIQDTLDHIMKLIRQDGSVAITLSLEIQSLLYRLFSQMMKESKSSEEFEETDWLEKSLDYIELHACEGISVQQVAEVAGVNRTYFSTIFAAKVGFTPMEYMTKVRMDKAKNLLIGSSATITEISYSLGYPTLFSFTRAFKNYVSTSPSDYRNSKQG